MEWMFFNQYIMDENMMQVFDQCLKYHFLEILCNENIYFYQLIQYDLSKYINPQPIPHNEFCPQQSSF